MFKTGLAALFIIGLALGGCAPKASKEDCQKAVDNLTQKGGLLGKIMGKEMMKDGDAKCEGRFTKKQAECFQKLDKVNETTLKGCE